MPQLQRLVISPTQLHDRQILLTDSQRHYLSRVLRLTAGDHFIALDGQGQSWLAALVQESGLQAEILQAVTAENELPSSVTLVAALPKGSGFDDVVRQCTELGVACIAPVISDRTLLQPSSQKFDRWRRIAQEAAEQSERQFVPTILDPVPFVEHLRELDATALKYFCAERRDAPHLLDRLQMPSAPAYSIAVGPEGGWTQVEVDRAIAAGYEAVSLGPRILRSVTAPLVALSLIAASLERSP
ncbi:16S rRNA (uracil(1498)-N(3))-methyltransferase [Leptolyngbya sp. FACHB-36]|uniref:16S rRNA (uracil(1498)-N(3))-methyltransferase n=1 Tax=Leptolyngbya sp. FACHB-36 TaxID=2692808 RepID=UPI0016816714|nr:16S rRNA (uracil(1498)-N(3))-methyltransferase [Leptolyngbya sp. FACHB-36]